MKGDGSCEMMKSWRESDVAARKAAKRSKSVSQLSTRHLPTWLGQNAGCFEGGGGGSRETGYEDWGIKKSGWGSFCSSCACFVEGDWIAQKKTNQRSTKTQVSKSTGSDYFSTRKG